MRSMTGYGSFDLKNDVGYARVEIKSVNNRYCDFNIRLPKHLLAIEDRVRNFLKTYIYRGKVDVYIRFNYINTSNVNIDVDLGLAREYYKALKCLKENLNLKDEISLRDIYSRDGIFLIEESKAEVEDAYCIIEVALKEALSNFIKMREIEGENLKLIFIERISSIKEMVDLINKKAPYVIEENTNKLKETIKTQVSSENLDIQRLSTEVAIMCDRLSIDEEITRLFIHLEQFNDIIKDEGSIGRKLDFLVQELNREINTIGSKTSDIEILNLVVLVKSEIEKLREQIQNIE